MEFAEYCRRMISDDGIERYQAGDIPLGYAFKCTYPTYRGCYICNIQKLSIFVDDVMIPQENIRFGINGKWFLLSAISDIHTEYWPTGTKATIRILDDDGISPGEHKVRMMMKHKIPYTGYFGNYLVLDADCEKILSVVEQ